MVFSPIWPCSSATTKRGGSLCCLRVVRRVLWETNAFPCPCWLWLVLSYSPPPSPSGTLTITSGHAQYQSVPVYEMKFPDLCVYWVAHEDLSVGSKAEKLRPCWVFRVSLMRINIILEITVRLLFNQMLGTYHLGNGGAVYDLEYL